MPVVVVVGGIAAASAGFAAIGAATGLAAFVAGAQIVGGVASVLGAVTGNKKLAKVGMIASLGATAVGAISSMATSASSLTAEAAGAAEVAGGASGASGLMGQAAAGDYASFAAKSAAPQLLSNMGSEAAGLTTSAVADIAKSVALDAPLSSSLAAAAPAVNAAAQGVQAAPVVNAAPAVNTSPTKIPAVNEAPVSGGLLSGFKDAAQGLSKFANDHPEAIKLTTGMLNGFSQAYSEKEKLQQAERMAEDKRKRMNKSITAIQSAYGV